MRRATRRALWHLAIMDRRAWKATAHWYSGWEYAAGGLIVAGSAVLATDDWLVVVLAGLAGALGAPFLLWAGTVAYKWVNPERRFETLLVNEKPGVGRTHGTTRAVGRQPVGDPWWQVEYPDGTLGNWFQRPKYAGYSLQSKTGGFNFDFDRRGQEGPFAIHFRGVIRAGDPPVPLATDHWHFTESDGWSRIAP